LVKALGVEKSLTDLFKRLIPFKIQNNIQKN
jgi:hypothetical protein